MKSFALFIVSAFCVSSLMAAEKNQSVVLNRPVEHRQLTGNIQVDFFGQQVSARAPQVQIETGSTEAHRKSSWVAAGLSLVVPGAGEFYAENYWKAALFIAVDVAAWAFAYSYDKKGNNQTDFFQGYANQHWSPRQYAERSLDNPALTAEQRTQFGAHLFKSGSTPWEQVNWTVLNELENVLSGTAAGKFYSHKLPPYGDQQYYELIGKYQQFYQGWDDANRDWDTYDEINAALTDGNVRFNYYSKERGKANDYYSNATTFVTVAIVNHVLSAVDAAWTAHSHNRSIHASMQMQTVPTEYGFVQVPVARVEYSF